MKITDNGLRIMLHKIEAELIFIELFAYHMYFEPRAIESEHHRCIPDEDNPAFSYQLDPDYRRLRQAIRRVEALRGEVSERL